MTLAVNIVRAVLSTAFVVLGGLELYELGRESTRT